MNNQLTWRYYFVTLCNKLFSILKYNIALSDQSWLLRQDNDVYLGNFPR